MTTFTVDLGNGRRAERTSRTRTYTHAVVNETEALSWHGTERHARDAQLARRRNLLERGRKADAIAVVPCQPVEVAARKAAVAADRKAKAGDAAHTARLLGRAVSDVAHYSRSAERSASLIADLEADRREMRDVRHYDRGGHTEFRATEVVMLTATHARGNGDAEFVRADQREERLANARVSLAYSTKRRDDAAKRQARLERALARLEQATA